VQCAGQECAGSFGGGQGVLPRPFRRLCYRGSGFVGCCAHFLVAEIVEGLVVPAVALAGFWGISGAGWRIGARAALWLIGARALEGGRFVLIATGRCKDGCRLGVDSACHRLGVAGVGRFSMP
jgi:hypothetical protein